VLTAFTAVSLVSLARHQATTETLRLFREGYLPLVLQVGEAKAAQRQFETVLDRMLEERDSTATRSWLRIARGFRPTRIDAALQAVARARGLDPSREDAVLLEQVAAKLEAVKRGYAEAEEDYGRLYAALDARQDYGRLTATLDARQLSAPARIRAELKKDERMAQRRLSRVADTLEGRIAGLTAQAAAQEREAVLVLGLLVLGTLLVGVTVTLWARRLLLPLPRLQDRVAAVARGDLSARLEPVRDDELGRLTQEFERMVDALATRDHRLRQAALARQRLERMREQIVADLRTALLVVDHRDRLRVANPAAATILEVGPEGVGLPLADTRLLARVPGLGEAIEEVRSGADRASLEAVPLGEQRRVDILVTPFETLEATGGQEDAATPGEPFGAAVPGEPGGAPRPPAPGSVLIVADDVTEELDTKARLIQSERLAAVGRMAAHVTHEVRNPLSSIGLNVDLLEDELAGDGGAEARVLLRAIRGEIDRLTGVTEEYLRLARLPAPVRHPEVLGEILRELGSFVEPELAEAGHTLRVEVDDDAIPPVPLDEGQLRQALLNLLRNAREAMSEPGEVTLEATVADDADGRGGVRIDVADQGAGMDAETRERLFEPFFTTKALGTGLGLPLTQQIVAAHGGRIDSAPRPGGGTVFSIWLPAAAGAAPGTPS
jgi:signal transduction histidine kinase